MAKILFISPHPDDESLSMGISIANHVWNGHEVYIALLTRGSSSSAINIINGSVYCSWHKRYHDPEKEGYRALSVQEFSDARVNEFKYSAACLGVKQENIMIYDLMDGSLTKDDVKEIIRDFISLYPDLRIKTTSYLDIHPDHSACGNGLLELYNEGRVTDARFYVSPGQWSNTPGSFESNPECSVFLRASLSAYKRWNPKCLLYGIGYHSVPSTFDNVYSSLKSKYHEPNLY